MVVREGWKKTTFDISPKLKKKKKPDSQKYDRRTEREEQQTQRPLGSVMGDGMFTGGKEEEATLRRVREGGG